MGAVSQIGSCETLDDTYYTVQTIFFFTVSKEKVVISKRRTVFMRCLSCQFELRGFLSSQLFTGVSGIYEKWGIFKDVHVNLPQVALSCSFGPRPVSRRKGSSVDDTLPSLTYNLPITAVPLAVQGQILSHRLYQGLCNKVSTVPSGKHTVM